MSNCVKTKKIYVDKFEEKYDEILYSVIGDIQEIIEESIKNGEWYESITFEIEELKPYDEKTIDNIIDDVYQYDGEDFTNEGFKIDMEIHDYTLYYYIAIDTDVNDGHLDYNLMDKLLTNDYLQDIEDVRRYIKVFNQYNTVLSNDDEIIVIDNEQHAKVTFYITAWGQWGHTMEEMDKGNTLHPR